MEIYFVFFFPPQKKKKETPPTLHTLPKPHKPTLQPKLCQRVQSCLHTEGIGRILTHTDMKEYINQIFRFLLLIVQKKRKRNLYKSNNIKTDFEAATTEIKIQRISSEPIPNLHEDTKTIEKNNISDTVLERLPIEVEENRNEEILNDLIHQTKYDNDVQIETVVNEPEIKYDTVDSEEDIKEADKTSIKEKSVTKNRVHETKPQVISNDADTKDKQQLAETLKKRKTTSIELKKDMDELLHKINRIFIEHKLLGNYDFTEDVNIHEKDTTNIH